MFLCSENRTITAAAVVHDAPVLPRASRIVHGLPCRELFRRNVGRIACDREIGESYPPSAGSVFRNTMIVQWGGCGHDGRHAAVRTPERAAGLEAP